MTEGLNESLYAGTREGVSKAIFTSSHLVVIRQSALLAGQFGTAPICKLPILLQGCRESASVVRLPMSSQFDNKSCQGEIGYRSDPDFNFLPGS